MSATIQKIRDRLERQVNAPDLTAAQARVLTYLLQCWMSGFIPTHREVGSALGFSSPAASYNHCRILERKGYLEAEEGSSGLILSDKSLDLVL